MKKYQHYINVRGEVYPTPRDTMTAFATLLSRETSESKW